MFLPLLMARFVVYTLASDESVT